MRTCRAFPPDSKKGVATRNASGVGPNQLAQEAARAGRRLGGPGFLDEDVLEGWGCLSSGPAPRPKTHRQHPAARGAARGGNVHFGVREHGAGRGGRRHGAPPGG